MKRMFPDSAIAQSLSMKRTKCTDVIKTMGRTMTNSLAKKLRTSKFSVIMDESTDVSAIKPCVVIVRFYDSSVQKITTAMLDLVNLNDSDNNAQGSTGQNLYSLLINTLTKYDIPLSNFIGFVADGASNMMGEHNSLCSRLKHLVPGFTVFKCICHSIHLCSSEAVKTLPRHCEDLLRSIYKFFAHSSKRQYDFKLSQEFCNTKPHKILHPSQTAGFRYMRQLEEF
ncbi:zinc finger protein 862-like [Palaemon carinicauda]|uniref:zinc finger protein 862-like n=1 Tax=Palaemon carinicauda TaxID=392227 RepID=UPI0035B66CED